MPNWTYAHEYVKGYAFSDEKVASVFGIDASDLNEVDTYINAAIRTTLGNEGYITLTCAYKEHQERKKLVVVIVMDDDEDKESLMKRPLTGPLHWTISRIMDILDGPDVWRKS